jgi:hypothetical protein
VTIDFQSTIIPFTDFFRSSYVTDTSLGFERKGALIDDLSASSNFLNLVPGEEVSFSCLVDVPREALVRVDLVVLGRRTFIGGRIGQWRSSEIVLPVEGAFSVGGGQH